MNEQKAKNQPGRVRDAIRQVLTIAGKPLSVREIEESVSLMIDYLRRKPLVEKIQIPPSQVIRESS